MNPIDDTQSNRHKAHDDVEFLANSWNRFDVLDAVAEGPRTRTELKELTNVSRVTLSRVLSDLEDRGWIVRETDRFEATNNGAVVAAAVSRLLDRLKTADEIGEALEWLPVHEFDFDLHHLRGMTVIQPDHHDLNAPTRDLIDMMYESSQIRTIATGINHEGMTVLRDEAVSGDLTLEYILTPQVIDAVANDPELRDLIADMCEAQGADVYRYLGDTPVPMVALIDEHVVICGHGDGDLPPGTIETTNDVVRSWAKSYLDDRLAEARLLETETFPP